MLSNDLRRSRSDECDSWQHDSCPCGEFGCRCACHLHVGQPLLIDLAGVLHLGTVAELDVEEHPDLVSVRIADQSQIRRVPIQWVSADISAWISRVV